MFVEKEENAERERKQMETALMLPAVVYTLPEDPWGKDEKYFTQITGRFLAELKKLREQEQDGIVDRLTVVNVILYGWAASRNWGLCRNPELKAAVDSTAQIAKKYGFTRVWKARYHMTMKRRFEDKTHNDMKDHKLGHCGRCGRILTNAVSIARGIGPICVHKRR